MGIVDKQTSPTAHNRSYPQPGDRAEMPNGEVGTVVEVLGQTSRRGGRRATMLQVRTANGLRIWASDDLASLARDLPSKVNPDDEAVVATTECPHEFGALGAISGDYCIHCGAKLSELKGNYPHK